MKHVLLSVLLGISAFVAEMIGYHQTPEPEVIVASIDSGVDCSHPDLVGRCVPGWDFVDDDSIPFDPCYDHGTRTAFFAANADNGIGIKGLSPNAKIMPLRVLDCGGTATEQRLVDAINYATTNGADLIQAVILISSAWPEFGGSFPALCDAIESSGIPFVTGVGNAGIDLDNDPRYPASCDRSNMIVVGAVDMDGSPIYNSGSVIDIRAYGIGIWVTTYLGYDQLDGGSYAVPQVTAAAANLLALRSHPTTELVSSVLQMQSGGVLTAFKRESSTPPPPPPPPPDGLLWEIGPTTYTGGDYDVETEWPSGAFTIEARVRFAGDRSREPIIARSTQADGRGFVLSRNAPRSGGNPLVFEFFNLGTRLAVEGGNLTAGNWYDVKITHDGSVVSLFLDGVLVDTANAAYPDDNGADVLIGAYLWSARYQRYMEGDVEYVRVWSELR